MEKYISDINEMLFMVYIHGGDNGGPYGVNDEGACVECFYNERELWDKCEKFTFDIK